MQTRYLFLLLALFLPGYMAPLAATFDEAAHISIREMGKRIAALEALLAKKENTLQIKAPLQIVDETGRVMLAVGSNASDGDFLKMGDFPAPTIALGRQSDKAYLTVGTDTDSKAILTANDKGVVALAIEEPAYTTRIGSLADQTGHGIFIRDAGGVDATGNTTPTKPLAEIASREGKKVALRMYDEQGNIVVSAGSNPAAAGAGTVRVANTKGENVAFMGTTPEGENGAVGVAKGSKDVIAMMAEPRLVAVYNDTGAPIAAIGKSDKSEGGNLLALSPDGDGVFSAGFNSAVGGGDACVYRAKKQSKFCLGIGVPGMGAIGR
ncbi:MAG: hypothetical protein RLZZ215_1032 [Pseudomonadota bacterium]|jgi:hypothetical protein